MGVRDPGRGRSQLWKQGCAAVWGIRLFTTRSSNSPAVQAAPVGSAREGPHPLAVATNPEARFQGCSVVLTPLRPQYTLLVRIRCRSTAVQAQRPQPARGRLCPAEGFASGGAHRQDGRQWGEGAASPWPLGVTSVSIPPASGAGDVREELWPPLPRPRGQPGFHRRRPGQNHLSQEQPPNHRAGQGAGSHPGGSAGREEGGASQQQVLTLPHHLEEKMGASGFINIC